MNNIDKTYAELTDSREMFSGTSFRMTEGLPNSFYSNDKNHIDFVSYKGCFLYCTKSHGSNENNAPVPLVNSNGIPTGIVPNQYGNFIFGGVNQFADGVPVLMPKLKIENGDGYISYDGTHGEFAGQATGDNGKDGNPGASAETIIPEFHITDGDLYVNINNTEYNLGRVVGRDGKDGEDGTDGKDSPIFNENIILSINVEYGISDSRLEEPIEGLDNIAEGITDKFIWMRNVYYYSNNTFTHSKPVCITGNSGAAGKGIQSVKELYYLSTSFTSLIGGSGSYIKPNVNTKRYIGTKNEIKYDNGDTYYTEPICVSGIEGPQGIPGMDGASYESIFAQSTVKSTKWSESGINLPNNSGNYGEPESPGTVESKGITEDYPVEGETRRRKIPGAANGESWETPHVHLNGAEDGISSYIGMIYTSSPTKPDIPLNDIYFDFVNGKMQGLEESGGTENSDTLEDNIWISQKIFTSNSANEHTGSVPISIVGKPLSVELTNEFDQIFVDASNAIISDQTFSTTISVWSGNEQLDIEEDEFTCSIEGITTSDYEITFDDDDNKNITLTLSGLGGTLENDLNVNIIYNNDVATVTKTLKLKRFKGSIDRDLIVSPTYLTAPYGTELTDKSYTITVNVLSRDLNAKSESFDGTAESDFYVTYIIGDTTEELSLEPDNNTGTITYQQSSPLPQTTTIKLYSNSDVLLDEVTVEVLYDGKPGEDGFENKYRYKQYTTLEECEKDMADWNANKLLYDDPEANEGSEDALGISEEYPIEAAIVSTYNREDNSYGPGTMIIGNNWGQKGEDGRGVEYIFKVSDQENIFAPNYIGDIDKIKLFIETTDDFIPNSNGVQRNEELIDDTILADLKAFVAEHEGTDSPSEVSKDIPKEYVSIRKKKDGKGGAGSEPKIGNEWHRDGYDTFTEFLFTSIPPNDTLNGYEVVGGTYENPTEDLVTRNVDNKQNIKAIEWSDTLPSYEDGHSIGMISSFFSSNINGEYYNGKWTGPSKMTDSQTLQVEYSNTSEIDSANITQLSTITNYTSLEDLESQFRTSELDRGVIWGDENISDPIWMATSRLINGIGSNWVVTRIKGEKGEPGEKGDDGTSIKIKGNFATETSLREAYAQYREESTSQASAGELDVTSFTDLTIGDCYVVTDDNNLGCYTQDDPKFDLAGTNLGNIKGADGNCIYTAFATYDGEKFTFTDGETGGPLGTTPGPYLGIYLADARIEGNFPNTNTDIDLFTFSKGEAQDGFGREQIFITTETNVAPDLPSTDGVDVATGNAPEYIPNGGSDFIPSDFGPDNRYCGVAWRYYPARTFNEAGYNVFKGNDGKATLYQYYPEDGASGKDGAAGKDANETVTLKLYSDQNTLHPNDYSGTPRFFFYADGSTNPMVNSPVKGINNFGTSPIYESEAIFVGKIYNTDSRYTMYYPEGPLKGSKGRLTDTSYLQEAFGQDGVNNDYAVTLGKVLAVTDDSKDIVAGITNGTLPEGDSTKEIPMIFAGAENMQDCKNAAFRVSSNGEVVANNLNITGGNINIGENFSVDATGKLTAKNVHADFFYKTISTETLNRDINIMPEESYIRHFKFGGEDDVITINLPYLYFTYGYVEGTPFKHSNHFRSNKEAIDRMVQYIGTKLIIFFDLFDLDKFCLNTVNNEGAEVCTEMDFMNIFECKMSVTEYGATIGFELQESSSIIYLEDE